ncbi:PVC-type heme-binding CxxCH protein [Singulisphaera sp. PoT]|uniref:PVC-type heme-binding CxxCH protein n=1 Tax=Singulisphaera sp. PoT TaxID=3411797 RepID=UPI003BF4AF1B
MGRPTFALASAMIGAALFLASPWPRVMRAAEEVSKEDAGAGGLFAPTKVVRVDLEVSPEEYQALQPPAMFGAPGAAPPPAPPKLPDGRERESEKNLFGVAFPWAQAALSVDGQARKSVGLRYAGNGSYFASAGGLKRSFKVDLERFGKGDLERLHAIQLQSGAVDPTKLREVLAYAAFREAGVPSPRTALAEVTLTVPGRYDKAYLGLYTLAEPVDRAFLEQRFASDAGLLIKPQGLRGIDFLGDDWAKYKGQYQPLSESKPAETARLIDFARLVQKADDRKFRDEIGSYLSVEKFLRFMAAQAWIANADGFFTLGYNYYLYLDPSTNKFVFIPGDQELSFANFLMMGSADKLMDMSLDHPYSGENKLVDRLMAIPEHRDAYRKIVASLVATSFKPEKIIAELEALEARSKAILDREAEARAERAEPPAGFVPPGAPQPPDLRTFAAKRAESVAEQLAGKREGYRPQFQLAPMGQSPPPKPMDDKTIGEVVKAPPGFRVSLFAAPPKVTYPVAISVGPEGDVYVAVDEQGSLGRTPGGGRVLRCIDDDGDGKADRVTTFASMEHPRGVVALGDRVWVLHAPYLSVYRDEDGDGRSDHSEVLVTGLTTSQIDERGGDHTTNGIRMGVDGWIYIAVGDYGFHGAKGKDGATLSQRGGGIIRVRPDGTELEVFASGLRNPFAIAIDPAMNLFTRDNTNDGAGWDTRVSHLIESGEYGYTQRFLNFTDEILPPLGAYGQGGGTGALSIRDQRWPKDYQDILLTGDWGRSEVYRHDLRADGASFRSNQDVFMIFPRPTGMDVASDGRLYVASWRGGEASVYVGPVVGFVATVTPPDWVGTPRPDLPKAGLDRLVEAMCSPNASTSFHAQREVIRRGGSPENLMALNSLATDSRKPLQGRVAAIFALKQLEGIRSHEALRSLATDPAVREFALRALADRRTELAGVDASPFVAALDDPSPRMRAQALIALGRLGDVSAAEKIIPLTSRPGGSTMPVAKPAHAQPDPDRIVPHLALRTLVKLRADDACLAAIDGPHRQGALRVLRFLHEPKVVEGLIAKQASTPTPEVRREVLETLIRLYHREADYKGSWWGIRPDTSGPYYDPQEWEYSGRIATAVKEAIRAGDAETVAFLRAQLARHRVRLDGVSGGEDVASAEQPTLVVIAKPDPKDPSVIGNMSYETASKRTLEMKGDGKRGKALFSAQGCVACHTDAEGQTPRGPHLVDIGRRYSAGELVESILRPGLKIAQGYEAYSFAMADGRVYSGFVVGEKGGTIQVREASGALHELKRDEVEERKRQEASAMPEGIVGTLNPGQLADLIAYLQSLK